MEDTFTPTVALLPKVRAWEPAGIPFEKGVVEQANIIAAYPFVKRMLLMPDSHVGRGAVVGSVIATRNVVVPSAVGVDIGCGLCAIKLGDVSASDLPDDLGPLRHSWERTVPMGTGAGYKDIPASVITAFAALQPRLDVIHEKTGIDIRRAEEQLGSLGAGNHFIELCIDENEDVWIMLHSGSRGVGNRIGQYYIAAAYKELEKAGEKVGRDYAWLSEGSSSYNDYCSAVAWAQEYAKVNREVMLGRLLGDLRKQKRFPAFTLGNKIISCHHNYISWEIHGGENLVVTRKGAISAKLGEIGIIPGSMGVASYIVEGLGNIESMSSASHGAGRMYSRSRAKASFTLKDIREATSGVECKKDASVLDEIPYAYKNLEAVMEAQKDLVKPIHTLKQILCCKG